MDGNLTIRTPFGSAQGLETVWSLSKRSIYKNAIAHSHKQQTCYLALFQHFMLGCFRQYWVSHKCLMMPSKGIIVNILQQFYTRFLNFRGSLPVALFWNNASSRYPSWSAMQNTTTRCRDSFCAIISSARRRVELCMKPISIKLPFIRLGPATATRPLRKMLRYHCASYKDYSHVLQNTKLYYSQ